MLSKEDNELLTRIEGSAPMGRMLRQHWWIPAAISSTLLADGAPQRVRLFGGNYVVYRASSGRVGFIDEMCPHRGASMALGRNEGDGIRCIYHGWKFSVEGRTVEVPTQPNNEAEYCKKVPLKSYPVREDAGVIWVWLGEGADAGATPPKFQDFVFTGLPEGHTAVFRQKVNANWVQGVETTMDSAHLGVLHQSWLEQDSVNAAVNQAPVYHLEPKPYGFRYAAVRGLPDGRSYVRTNSFVSPWYGIISPRRAGDTTRGGVFFSVPMDDENTWYWHISYKTDTPLPYESRLRPSDPNDWPPAAPGTADDHWGQDREAMRLGHFTGFPQSLGTEDFAVISSMGPIVDRSKEFLGAGDGAVVQVRRTLLAAVRDFVDGKTPLLARHEDIAYADIRPAAALFQGEARWREML